MNDEHHRGKDRLHNQKTIAATVGGNDLSNHHDAPTQSKKKPRAQRKVKDSPSKQRCPVCGFDMPDLRGGTLSVCRNCGHKDDCC